MSLQAKKNISMNKKGVSIMIGYVLLVTTAIIISVVVYQWIKTYVPKDALKCDEGASILLKDYAYDCDTQIMNLTIRNNGRFNLAGYFIFATNGSDQELAAIDISEYSPDGRNKGGSVLFGTSNSFEPNDERVDYFYLNNSDIGRIYSIEIIPVRFQEEEGREKLASCSDDRIKETLSCYEKTIVTPSSCDGSWNPPEDTGVECDGGDNCITEDQGECTCEEGYVADEEGGCLLYTECSSGQLIGDADGNGLVETADGILISEVYVENVAPPANDCCMDVDDDGDIDIIDAVKANQIAQGIIPSPGVCE